MSLRDRVNERMDLLQKYMETDHHLNNPEEVRDLISNKISPFWELLNDEDKDYVQWAEEAVEKCTPNYDDDELMYNDWEDDYDDEAAFTSAGMGTDESYGYYGDDGDYGPGWPH